MGCCMNTKIILLAISVILVTACQPATQQQVIDTSTQQAAQSAENTESSCEMTLGMDAWEPYQYMTVGHTPAGLDVELVQAVTKSMNCKLSVVQGSWLELLSMLREGDIDFVLGASKTEDRESFAYFSEPYRQERFQLYVRADQKDLAFDDLRAFVTAGHKVGVVNEYFYGDEVATIYADEALRDKLVGALISELNMARLLDEEIDGLLEDSFVGASILRRKGLDKYIQPHNISLGNADVFVMFSKASINEQQVQQFNQALAKLRSNGAYDKLMEKYSN